MARAAFHLLDVQTSGSSPEAGNKARIPHIMRIKDLEREAIRLRGKGWSYRRIAESLKVQYILVSRWLSGLDQPLVRQAEPADERVNVSRAAAALSRDAASGLRTLAAQYDRLEARIDEIARTIDAAKAREQALSKTVDELKTAVAALSS